MDHATDRTTPEPSETATRSKLSFGFSALDFFSRDTVPIRIHIARQALSAILVSCLIALAIVCSGLAALHAIVHVELSGPIPIVLAACCLCLLTLALSTHRIMRSSRQLAKPIEALSKEAALIAQGDFGARIDTSRESLDVAELNAMVDSFNTMAKALGEMDYLRRDFTSSVSHEFKTPIAAITGMCELVRDPKLPESERAEYLELIHEQALRLSTLCESILSLSRLEAQSIVSSCERTDVDEQIRRDVIMLSERWSNRKITLDLDLDSLPIETDPHLTHQIWINLIDNAYKYTPDGGMVKLTSRTLPDGTQVQVADTGRGMTPSEAEHAFDRFYQADRSHSKEGSGLGLSIVKRICELLGGTIACESSPGSGTVMTVTLPRTIRDSSTRPASNPLLRAPSIATETSKACQSGRMR